MKEARAKIIRPDVGGAHSRRLQHKPDAGDAVRADDQRVESQAAAWSAAAAARPIMKWSAAPMTSIVVCGQSATIGGPSIPLTSSANKRRTFYASISRHSLDGLLRLFDFPDFSLLEAAHLEGKLLE